MNQRQQNKTDKQFDKQFKSICHLRSSLFAKTKTRNSKKTNSIKKKITTLPLLDSHISLILLVSVFSSLKQQSQREDKDKRDIVRDKRNERDRDKDDKTVIVI